MTLKTQLSTLNSRPTRKSSFFPTGLLKKTYGSRTYPVEYTFDAQGRMKTMKTWQNFAGNSGTATTTWNYDGHRGWLRGKVYADGQGPLYTNTPAGRLYTRTWARQVAGLPLATTYGYNNAGDLTTVTYSDGSAGITYGHDRQGRRTSAAQGATAQSFLFNDAGLLLSESFSGGPLNGLSVTNSLDQFLRRTNLAILKSSTPAVEQSFSYDGFSRLQTVAEGASSATYSYVAYSSRVGEIQFSYDAQLVMRTTKQHDGLNRLTNITTLDASEQVLDSHGYAYNTANQRTNHVLRDSSFWVYTYDGLGQVTSGRKYWPNGTPVAGLQFTYGFDEIGNRKSGGSGGDRYGGNLHYQNYTANTLNQYTSRTVPGFVDVTGSANSNAIVSVWGDNGASAQSIRQGEHFYAALPVNNPTGAVWLTLTNVAVLPDPGNPDIATNTTGKALVTKTPESFTYDFDGNLTSDGLWANTWNMENRRTLVESKTTVPAGGRAREQWTYLPDGRWIERIVSAHNGSVWVLQYTNRYVWDGQVLMAVLDHTNGVVLSFLRGLDLSGSMQGAGGVGGLLAVSQFWDSQITNSHFACFDGNGNVMALVAANDGTLSAEYEYGPFGEPIRLTGPVAAANPIRFSTQYADEVTGELKYLFRDYNPANGRWGRRDPIGESGGANLYSFVGNDPCSFADILGLEWTYKRDSSKPRATATCCAGDTIDDLAEMIKLDPAEFQKWLLALDKKPMPKTSKQMITEDRKFTIPNVALMTQGDSSDQRGYDIGKFLVARKALLKKHYLDLGYMVIDHVSGAEDGQQLAEVTSALQSPQLGAFNVYVWAHYGHGAHGDLSFAKNLEQMEFIRGTPSQFTPHHKLAEVVLYACESGMKNQEWLKHVAPGGTLYSSVPRIFPLVGDLSKIGGGWSGAYQPLKANKNEN